MHLSGVCSLHTSFLPPLYLKYNHIYSAPLLFAITLYHFLHLSFFYCFLHTSHLSHFHARFSSSFFSTLREFFSACFLFYIFLFFSPLSRLHAHKTFNIYRVIWNTWRCMHVCVCGGEEAWIWSKKVSMKSFSHSETMWASKGGGRRERAEEM